MRQRAIRSMIGLILSWLRRAVFPSWSLFPDQAKPVSFVSAYLLSQCGSDFWRQWCNCLPGFCDRPQCAWPHRRGPQRDFCKS